MINARRFMKWYSFISIASLFILFLKYYSDREFLYTHSTVYNENYFIADIRQADLTINVVSDDQFLVTDNERDDDNETDAGNSVGLNDQEKLPSDITAVKHENIHDNMSTYQNKMVGSNIKKIIWYDVMNDGHGLKNKGKLVDFQLCPHKNCVRMPDYTIDEESKNDADLKNADAVIFQAIHYAIFYEKVHRQPGQIFVFAERESGWEIGCDDAYKDPKFKNVFNWTMTFRRDSDIPMLYGDILSKINPERKLLTDDGKQASQITRSKSFSDVYAEKDLEVVWLVSHCKTNSFRESYIAELQKYIHVDIIGRCGKNTCPKRHSKQCLARITRRYKFILSFENTFQTDYVTEKLYDWISRDIVQVVFGFADYSEITPRRTVINTANFVTPKHLADYLKDVGSDKAKYIHYLKKKDQYFSVGHTEMQQRAYCQLCEMLHNVNSYRKSYSDIVSWWQTKNFSRVNSFVYQNVTETTMRHACKDTR